MFAIIEVFMFPEDENTVKVYFFIILFYNHLGGSESKKDIKNNTPKTQRTTAIVSHEPNEQINPIITQPHVLLKFSFLMYLKKI